MKMVGNDCLMVFNLNGERITNHSTGFLSLGGAVMLTVVPLKPPGRERETDNPRCSLQRTEIIS